VPRLLAFCKATVFRKVVKAFSVCADASVESRRASTQPRCGSAVCVYVCAVILDGPA
jgi:hypothetical protein